MTQAWVASMEKVCLCKQIFLASTVLLTSGPLLSLQLPLPSATMAQNTPTTLLRVLQTPLYDVLLDRRTMYIVLHENTTDASLELQPLNRDPTPDANGNVNYHVEVEAGAKIDKLYRSKLGAYLYEHVVKADLEKEGVQRASSIPSILLEPIHTSHISFAIISLVFSRQSYAVFTPASLHVVDAQEGQCVQSPHGPLPPW